MSRNTRAIFLAALSLSLPGAAYAQESSTLIQPSVPAGFDRGRNVSVTERPHPDFDALGIRAGAFIVSPQLTLGAAATNNVYLSQSNAKVGDVFAIVTPYLRIGSDWNVHSLELQGAGDIRRFESEKLRNQNAWYLKGAGRVDVATPFSVFVDGNVGRSFESPYSGAVASNVSVLSSYLRTAGAVRAEYKAGRTRLVVAYDHTNFKFNTIKFGDGTTRTQKDRNRNIDRLVGQAEYALSPSVSVYGEVTYDNSRYPYLLLNGQANRDSNSYRLIGGFNFDISALMRGRVGIGYAERDYKSGIYRDATGFSAQAQIDFFPSELTTVSIFAQRVIEDSSLSGSGAYFDNRLSGRVDHELLENLILQIGGEVSRQDYLRSTAKNDTWRVFGGGKFQMTRNIGFGADVSYGGADPNNFQLGGGFKELRGQLSVTFRR
jgi:hypothetical protein